MVLKELQLFNVTRFPHDAFSLEKPLTGEQPDDKNLYDGGNSIAANIILVELPAIKFVLNDFGMRVVVLLVPNGQLFLGFGHVAPKGDFVDTLYLLYPL